MFILFDVVLAAEELSIVAMTVAHLARCHIGTEVMVIACNVEMEIARPNYWVYLFI